MPLATLSGTRGSTVSIRAGRDPVANQYIVVLKDASVHGLPSDAALRAGSAISTLAIVNQLEIFHHVRALRKYDTVLRGFMIRTSQKKARELAADPRVKYVEQDGIVRAAQTVPWGLARIDHRNLPLDSRYSPTSSGEGVHVYILDTGIRTTHQDFEGRADSPFGTAGDCNGHGTHVAGIVGGRIFGVAKAVHLHSVQVLGCDGTGAWSAVIDGINWVTKHHASPAVVNMSLDGSADDSLDKAIHDSIASGLTYVVSAGDDNADACGYSPPRGKEAISVGAAFVDGRFDTRVFDLSNFGPCVDLFAPGLAIESAWNSDDAASITLDGTSMAAPHVAGIAALYLEKCPNASPAQVKQAVVSNAVTLNKIASIGAGSPNRLAYMGTLPACAAETAPVKP